MKNSEIVEELVKIKIDIDQNHSYAAKDKINSLMEKLCNSGSKKKVVSKSHHDSCLSELDPYGGPCTCRKYDNSDYSDYDL